MFTVVAVVTVPFIGEEVFSDNFSDDTAWEAAASALSRWNSLRPMTLVSVERA